jgi:hydroxymethylbilane synthase
MKLRLGTRGSDLALWQARHVAGRLAGRAEVEIVVLQTQGDLIDDVPLTQVDGKAFFTAEIERALLDGQIDLAVHSHKDLPTESPPGLQVVAVTGRADAAELLLALDSGHDPAAPFLPLRRGARVGTSSPRRSEQLLTMRPDLRVEPLRGNVPTRVQRLREGKADAILLARAGVERLGLDLAGLHATRLEPEVLVPAPAQGALAVQIREGEAALAALLREALHDEATQSAVAAERWLLAKAGGGCNLPLGAHVLSDEKGWRVIAFLGADHPEDGDDARWIEARGATPLDAVYEAHRKLRLQRPTGRGPLAGLRVALAGRADYALGTTVGRRLAQLGARVQPEAVLHIEELPAPELESRVTSLRAGDAIVLTSQVAVQRVSAFELPAGVLVAAVGRVTASFLEMCGLRADVVGEGGSRDLAPLLTLTAGARVLLPGAEDGRPELAHELEARGIQVERVALYRTAPAATRPATPATPAAARVYLSPSAVRACLALGMESPAPAVRLAWGDATAEALAAAGLGCDGNARADAEAIVHLLARLHRAPEPTR